MNSRAHQTNNETKQTKNNTNCVLFRDAIIHFTSSNYRYISWPGHRCEYMRVRVLCLHGVRSVVMYVLCVLYVCACIRCACFMSQNQSRMCAITAAPNGVCVIVCLPCVWLPVSERARTRRFMAGIICAFVRTHSARRSICRGRSAAPPECAPACDSCPRCAFSAAGTACSSCSPLDRRCGWQIVFGRQAKLC